MESRYELIIYWSKDDQRFIVEVTFPQKIVFQG